MENEKFDREIRDLAERVAEELEENKKRVEKMRKSDSGKYRVIWVDKFDGSDGLHGEYDTAEEALREARQMTRDGMKLTSDYNLATVYYAYNPKGEYIGGDDWIKE